MKRPGIPLLLLVMLDLGSVAGADPTAVKRIDEGQSMPLHVVHFVAGARETGKGCPSVMISNRGHRGFEIWSSSPTDRAFALAAALETVLDADSQDQAFLIVEDQLPAAELIELAGKHGVNKTTVCVPNSKKLFQNAEFTKDRDLILFLLERKRIMARHDCKASEVNAEVRRELVEVVETFLAAAP